jgi:hypothetical protein
MHTALARAMPGHPNVASDFSPLRQIVRQRMDAGELPCQPGPDKLWAGKGGGGLCSGCGQPIHPSDNEYEVVIDADFPATAGSLFFHRRCLDIWIAECRERTV